MPFHDPVVILGPPRSGTTLLFSALARHSSLWSLGRETTYILEGPLHPRHRGWEPHAPGDTALAPHVRASLLAAMERDALPGTVWRRVPSRLDPDLTEEGLARRNIVLRRERWKRRLLGLFRRSSVRFLEKTPDNCLRIGIVRDLFPGARYVVLHRDGRPTVSSMMDAWRRGGFFAKFPDIPAKLEISGYDGTAWCFPLVPGWRDLCREPLEVVAATQWAACATALADALPGLTAAGIAHVVAYEDLIAHPRDVLSGILRFLELPWDAAVLPGGDRLAVINAPTPPSPDKWRRTNGEAISRVAGILAPGQRAFGYPVEP